MVTVFARSSKDKKSVGLIARMEGEGMIGDYRATVEKGQSIFGLSFDEWLEVATTGGGSKEIEGDEGDQPGTT